MTSRATQSVTQNVSRETFLAEYVALLLKWNAKINLIGASTEAEIWARHIEDSAQIVPLVPAAAKSLVDLGSGAGLPGLVIAIHRPDLAVTLVERDQRKAAFLTEARHRLGLENVTIFASDIADLNDYFDVVTSRALAPLPALATFAFPRLNAGGRCLFLKGEAYAEELAALKKNWQVDCAVHPSQTDVAARILEITALAPSSNSLASLT